MPTAGLPPDRLSEALTSIAAWRMGRGPLMCPSCGAEALSISDHSARPHAEWYRLACAACGLDQMLTVPLGAAVPGGED